jgi:hypothetical protein
MNKPQITKINLSTPFPTRARCKYCGKHPEVYFYMREPYLFRDATKVTRSAWSAFMRMITGRLTGDFYLSASPSEYRNVSDFAYKPDHKYNPKAHKNKGVPATENKVEYLMCGNSCGKTVWAFTDKAIVNRPEILNRKARATFPKKIDSY